MNPFYIVGVGPGCWDLLTLRACQIISDSDIVAASSRALETVDFLYKEKAVQPELFYLKKNREELLTLIRQRGTKKLSVLVSGDPGFYSLLAFLSLHFNHEEYHVIPGISSIQAAASSLGMTWQNSLFYSVHGRDSFDDFDRLKAAVNPGTSVFVLLDSKQNASWFVGILKENDFPVDRMEFTLFYNLEYEDQEIFKLSYEDLMAYNRKDKLCLMMITIKTGN